MRVMLFRDAGYGRAGSGPSGLGPVGMDLPHASFVCIGDMEGVKPDGFTVSEASPQYRRFAQYRRPWGSQYGHAESAEEQRAPSMGCGRLVIVLFLWLGEPFSSFSTLSALSTIIAAVLDIARCGPSGLGPP